MKKNSTKSLKWLFALAIIFGTLYLALKGVQTSSLLFGAPNPSEVEWIDSIRLLQTSVIILNFAGAIALFTILTLFIFNSIKALKDGTLFPKKNVGLLFGCAAAAFVCYFCDSNMHLINGIRTINFGFAEIIVPVVICIFAIIYRIAVQVCEENRLTI